MKEGNSKQVSLYIGIAVCLAILLALSFSIFEFLNELLIGTFGLMTFVVLVAIMVYLCLKIANKVPQWKRNFVVLTLVYVSLILLLLHFLFSLNSFDNSFSEILEHPYKEIKGAAKIVADNSHEFARKVSAPGIENAFFPCKNIIHIIIVVHVLTV